LNGFLVENEVASLTQKISELMEYPDAVKKAGEGARKTIYHPWENIVDEVYFRYADIIRKHQPAVSMNNEE
jgi:glycosyltransferase involved in cell wall biosynthesis